MRIAQEEVFGPVMVIIRAKDVDEALGRARTRSPYGNAARVFTESGGVARYVMENASAGMVGVNVGVPVPREPFGFGGWNESKFGVGDITGRGSIEFWTKSKKMTTKWNTEAGVNWMSRPSYGRVWGTAMKETQDPEQLEEALDRELVPEPDPRSGLISVNPARMHANTVLRRYSRADHAPPRLLAEWTFDG